MRQYIRPAPYLDILEEHMEEAAYLYHCLRRSGYSPESSFEDLQGYERRMAHHLHALVLGGFESAKYLKKCLALPEDGDAGEAFVAAAVFPELERVEPIQWLTAALSATSPHHRALVEGLKYSHSPNLAGWISDYLAHPVAAVRSAGAELASAWPEIPEFPSRVAALCQDHEPLVALAAMEGMFMMGSTFPLDRAWNIARAEDPGLVAAALTLLVCAGDVAAGQAVRELCIESEPGLAGNLLSLLAISGSGGESGIILGRIRKHPELRSKGLLALGLCGDPEITEILIDYLANPEDSLTFLTALKALTLLTGVCLPPQFDPDETSPEEVAEYQGGWRDILADRKDPNALHFRWRRGEKISPALLHKELSRPGNPCRHETFLELVIRYGCPVRFHHDGRSATQIAQIKRIEEWVGREGRGFTPGQPLFKGKVV